MWVPTSRNVGSDLDLAATVCARYARGGSTPWPLWPPHDVRLCVSYLSVATVWNLTSFSPKVHISIITAYDRPLAGDAEMAPHVKRTHLRVEDKDCKRAREGPPLSPATGGTSDARLSLTPLCLLLCESESSTSTRTNSPGTL